jgi:hypothetical protein
MGDRYGSHSYILCHIIEFLKNYIVYGSALTKHVPRDN